MFERAVPLWMDIRLKRGRQRSRNAAQNLKKLELYKSTLITNALDYDERYGSPNSRTRPTTLTPCSNTSRYSPPPSILLRLPHQVHISSKPPDLSVDLRPITINLDRFPIPTCHSIRLPYPRLHTIPRVIVSPFRCVYT